ncbi:unnamed protein product [Coccothraustes coccothraustes]
MHAVAMAPDSLMSCRLPPEPLLPGTRGSLAPLSAGSSSGRLWETLIDEPGLLRAACPVPLAGPDILVSPNRISGDKGWALGRRQHPLPAILAESFPRAKGSGGSHLLAEECEIRREEPGEL